MKPEFIKEEETRKFESMLFSLCQTDDNKASVKTFLEEIQRVGIRPKTDPRFRGILNRLQKFKSRRNVSLESLNLDFDQFCATVEDNLPLIVKIFRNDLVIPEFDTFTENVSKLYHKLKKNFDGTPAAYIPQLARMPSSKWGISICTVDGQRFSIGDVHDKFTIQSTSKPVTYALTLEELGTEMVHKYQGREPSGRMFNEIVLDHNNQPHNPMVNSGAIMSASILLHLVKPEFNMAQKYDYVLAFFRKMAGGEYVGFNNSVFLSERDTADRNFALAYFLRENMCFPPGNTSIQNTLDFYFQTCSLEMTAESESIIAATLANGGVCPITNQRSLSPESVRNVLSLMLSCGLYNYSGDFAFKVGLPAKSGVSGALVLVVPNVMGICFWSPPLDEMGNTVRGVQFCEEFVRIYSFHKVSGELNVSLQPMLDPTKNRYEVASQLLIRILMAASAGDETALKSSHQQGVNMNTGDYDGRTALHLASAEGHVRCVRFLLDVCQVKYDCKDRWGQTPLTDAIRFKHIKVAAILKGHGRIKSASSEQTSPSGEVLWKNMVEQKFIVGKRTAPLPSFKFEPPNSERNEKVRQTRPAKSTSANNNDLSPLVEEQRLANLNFDDGELEELSKAALVIQEKFRAKRLNIKFPKQTVANGNNGVSMTESRDSVSPTSEDSGTSV